MENNHSIEEAKLLDAAVNSLSDYFVVVDIPGSKNYLALLTQKAIPIGNNSVLSAGLYALEVDAPHEIISIGRVEGEAAIDPDLFTAKGRIREGGLLFYQLIIDIYTNCNISEESAQRVKRFIDLMQDRGEVVDLSKMTKRSALKMPSQYSFMNDKVNAVLITDKKKGLELSGQECWIVQSPKSKTEQPRIRALIGLTYEGDDITVKRRLTGFDMAVYNSICTLYVSTAERSNDPAIFTPQDIWSAMNGIKGRGKPSRAQVEKITRAVDKMRFTSFFCDVTEELKAGYIKAPDGSSFVKGVYQGYLLAANKSVFVTEKGNIIEGYGIIQKPILYEYNALKGHVINVDFDLLDTSKKVSNSEDVIVFRAYLLQQIQLLKHGSRNNPKILFETIYEETGTPAPGNRVQPGNYTNDSAYQTGLRKAAKADKDKIEGILSSWIDKGWISGFQEVKKGRSVIGVVVEYKENRLIAE